MAGVEEETVLYCHSCKYGVSYAGLEKDFVEYLVEVHKAQYGQFGHVMVQMPRTVTVTGAALRSRTQYFTATSASTVSTAQGWTRTMLSTWQSSTGTSMATPWSSCSMTDGS